MVVDTAGWVARCMFGGDEMSQHHTHGLSAKRAEAEVKHTFRPSSVTVHGIARIRVGVSMREVSPGTTSGGKTAGHDRAIPLEENQCRSRPTVQEVRGTFEVKARPWERCPTTLI